MTTVDPNIPRLSTESFRNNANVGVIGSLISCYFQPLHNHHRGSSTTTITDGSYTILRLVSANEEEG